MALSIRMSRGGSKKRPFYRIVVADSRAPRDGRFIEKLGFHNPMLARDHEDRVRLNVERIKHWLSVGAQPSDRVARFLADADLIAKPAAKTNADQPKKSSPGAKAQERIREREEKEREAAEAAAAAAAEAEEAANAPSEEAADETSEEAAS